MAAEEVPFLKTPHIIRFAVWLTFMNSWVLFEEIVVDRSGLWKYMPYYRVAKLCLWDLGAMAVFGLIVWWAFRGNRLSPKSIT